MKTFDKIEFNKEDGAHQSILNAAYAMWQDETNNIHSYQEMLEAVQTKYGELARIAVQLGKYNQQVCNGGHLQYFYNGYGSAGNDECADSDLHEDLIIYLKASEITDVPLAEEVLKIADAAFPEYDEDRYVEEECYDEEDDEYYMEQVDNQEYGSVINDAALAVADTAYYKINEEWMENLEAFFAKKFFA